MRGIWKEDWPRWPMNALPHYMTIAEAVDDMVGGWPRYVCGPVTLHSGEVLQRVHIVMSKARRHKPSYLRKGGVKK